MTDNQRAEFEAWYDTRDPRTPQSPFDRKLAWEAWQAALESSAAQALRKDGERYRWLRDPCSGAEYVIFYSRGDYGKGLMSGAMLDETIDHARRVEGEGE